MSTSDSVGPVTVTPGPPGRRASGARPCRVAGFAVMPNREREREMMPNNKRKLWPGVPGRYGPRADGRLETTRKRADSEAGRLRSGPTRKRADSEAGRLGGGPCTKRRPSQSLPLARAPGRRKATPVRVAAAPRRHRLGRGSTLLRIYYHLCTPCAATVDRPAGSGSPGCGARPVLGTPRARAAAGGRRRSRRAASRARARPLRLAARGPATAGPTAPRGPGPTARRMPATAESSSGWARPPPRRWPSPEYPSRAGPGRAE